MNRTLLALAIALTLPLHAGEWGSRGAPKRFLLNGDRLYAADGRGVSVYDVASSTNIRRIDVETGDDESRDVALLGGTQLLLATARGLDRFAVAADGTLTRADSFRDIRDLTRVAANDHVAAIASARVVTILADGESGLVRQQHIELPYTVRALAFVGDVLYIAVAETAVYAYDVNTATELGLVPFDASDLARSGSTLWAAGPQGLLAIDVSDPRAPRAAGHFGSGVMRLSAIAVAGTRVYAAESPGQLRVFDGASPQEPRLVSTIQDWVHAVAASGTRVFISGSRIDDEGLPFETGIPVRVYDGGTVAGEFTDLAGPVSGAWTDGSFAFIVDPPYFRVLDVSQTAQPRELASIVVPRIQDHVRVRDGLAILYGRSDVNFIDVSDPYKPKYLGTYDAEGHPPSAAAFLRDTLVEANEHSGLHIVDYSDFNAPVQIAGRIWHYHDVVAGDDAVYVLQVTTFLALDVTDRRHVVDRQIRGVEGYAQIETIPPNSGSPRYLVWRGINGIVFLTLEDRFAPREIASVPMTPKPEMMGTSATSVFTSVDGSLLRVDADNPAAVHETGMRVISPLQIAVSGEKVVVADRYSVKVYGPDTTPPPPPAPLPVARRRSLRH